MKQEVIHTSAAPAPIGPYNQAIKAGNMIFVSGQVALDAATGNLVMDSIDMEAHQVMKNVQAVLKAANAGLGDVVKTTIFLSDMALFGAVNEVYGSYFTETFPARETIAVKGLPRGVNVEISVIAIVA